jgi:hypothetical protein
MPVKPPPIILCDYLPLEDIEDIENVAAAPGLVAGPACKHHPKTAAEQPAALDKKAPIGR